MFGWEEKDKKDFIAFLKKQQSLPGDVREILHELVQRLVENDHLIEVQEETELNFQEKGALEKEIAKNEKYLEYLRNTLLANHNSST